MIKFNISKLANDVRRLVSKRSPEILTGIGIAGMVTTTVLAVKATPKALYLLDEAENEKEDELTKLEVVKIAWKAYIPSIISGVFSASCLIGANSVNAKRNAALATAYKLSETALLDYKAAVVETIGEKKEAKVRDKAAQKNLDRKQIKMNADSNIVIANGDTWFMDGMSGRLFKSSVDKVKSAVNELNRTMTYDMYVSVSDLYDALGLSHTNISDDLGWNLDDGLIELDLGTAIADNGEPCIVLNWHVAPRYDFSKLS